MFDGLFFVTEGFDFREKKALKETILQCGGKVCFSPNKQVLPTLQLDK